MSDYSQTADGPDVLVLRRSDTLFKLVDLHVYVVPADIWRDRYNNLLNQSVTETISVGIIRVQPDVRLADLRDDIIQQLEDLAPREYVFLRSVGRSLTRLKTKQEYTLKVKHFLPPVAYAPELFLLEACGDVSLASEGDSRSQSSFRQLGDSPKGNNRGYNYRDDYRDPGSRSYRDDKYNSAADLQTEKYSRSKRGGDRVSPSRRYTPIPRLDPSSPTGSRDPSPERTEREQQYRSNSRSPDQNYSKYDDRKNTDRYDDPSKSNNDRDDPHDQRDNRYNYDNRYDNRDDNYNDPDAGNDTTRDRFDHESTNHRRNHGYKQDGGGETYRRLSPDPESSVHSYPVLPPINDTPPRSAERGPGKQGENKDRSSDPRSATYTTNTNTDSGIADSGVSPEDQYNRGRDNYEDELARKRRDLGHRLANEKFDIYDDDAFRFEDMEDRDQIDRDRWERDREYRRRWIEEERRRREDELEARKKRQEAGEEDEDDDERKKMKRSESEEELARYPSPPELRMDSPRDTESARQRTRQERDRLMQELENAREGRKHTEKEREELVKKAKMLQNKTQNRRNHARDIWKKRYFEEKKKTAPLEEQTNRLKHELDSIHRKLMSALEGPKEKNIRLGEPKPSLKNNYIIQCTKLQHEIEDLRRRVENAKMKLTAEMKLRTQADAELRVVRSEALQSKIKHRGHAFSQIY